MKVGMSTSKPGEYLILKEALDIEEKRFQAKVGVCLRSTLLTESVLMPSLMRFEVELMQWSADLPVGEGSEGESV
jgi:hypothetical protein